MTLLTCDYLTYNRSTETIIIVKGKRKRKRPFFILDQFLFTFTLLYDLDAGILWVN